MKAYFLIIIFCFSIRIGFAQIAIGKSKSIILTENSNLKIKSSGEKFIRYIHSDSWEQLYAFDDQGICNGDVWIVSPSYYAYVFKILITNPGLGKIDETTYDLHGGLVVHIDQCDEQGYDGWMKFMIYKGY